MADDLSTDTQYLKRLATASEALANLINGGKIPVDTELTATIDPTGLLQSATAIGEYNITCTLANTEYSQALPANRYDSYL